MTGAADRAVPARPARRLVGLPFGELRSPRRGPGSDVAGSRPYRPGDPSTDRLARVGAPLVCARHATSSSSASTSPTRRRASSRLRPPAVDGALRRAVAVAAEAAASRRGRRRCRRAARSPRAGEVGYLDHARRRRQPYWLPPRSRRTRAAIAERAARRVSTRRRTRSSGRSSTWPGFGAPCRPGSFVFVVSDFLVPLAAERGCGCCAPRAGTSSPSSSRTRSGSRASRTCRRRSCRSRTRPPAGPLVRLSRGARRGSSARARAAARAPARRSSRSLDLDPVLVDAAIRWRSTARSSSGRSSGGRDAGGPAEQGAAIAILAVAALVVAAVVALCGAACWKRDGPAGSRRLGALRRVHRLRRPPALSAIALTAHAEVIVDGRRVNADGVRIEADFTPFAPRGRRCHTHDEQRRRRLVDVPLRACA